MDLFQNNPTMVTTLSCGHMVFHDHAKGKCPMCALPVQPRKTNLVKLPCGHQFNTSVTIDPCPICVKQKDYEDGMERRRLQDIEWNPRCQKKSITVSSDNVSRKVAAKGSELTPLMEIDEEEKEFLILKPLNKGVA